MGQPAPRKSCQSYAKICFYCQIYHLNKEYYAFYWFGKEISVPAEKTKTEKTPCAGCNVSYEPWMLWPSENPPSKLGCFQPATASPLLGFASSTRR